jgi:isochorismate hydrolase
MHRLASRIITRVRPTARRSYTSLHHRAMPTPDDVIRSRIAERDRVLLFICDMQEKFAKAITGFDHVVHAQTVLIQGLHAMNDLNDLNDNELHQIYLTEQVPEKLGRTVEPLKDALNDFYKEGYQYNEKTRFSMIDEEFWKVFPDANKRVAVVTGIEAHVCVLQTVLDLLQSGCRVHVCVDAVSSIRPEDRAVALRRMESAGAYLATTESILFEMLGDADAEPFRAVSAAVRAKRPDTPALPSI